MEDTSGNEDPHHQEEKSLKSAGAPEVDSSLKDVKTINDTIEKAVKDKKFFKDLFYDPQETLQDSGLSPDDKNQLINFLKQLTDQDAARKKVDKVFDNTLDIFMDMRWMNKITFAVGFSLIVIAVILIAKGSTEIYVVLFGGGGIVTLILQLLVGPMERAPLALSTFLQSHIIFDSYNHQVGIWYEFQQDKRKCKPSISLDEALIADAAHTIFREQSVQLLQQMQNKKSSDQGEKQPASDHT